MVTRLDREDFAAEALKGTRKNLRYENPMVEKIMSKLRAKNKRISGSAEEKVLEEVFDKAFVKLGKSGIVVDMLTEDQQDKIAVETAKSFDKKKTFWSKILPNFLKKYSISRKDVNEVVQDMQNKIYQLEESGQLHKPGWVKDATGKWQDPSQKPAIPPKPRTRQSEHGGRGSERGGRGL